MLMICSVGLLVVQVVPTLLCSSWPDFNCHVTQLLVAAHLRCNGSFDNNFTAHFIILHGGPKSCTSSNHHIDATVQYKMKRISPKCF